MTDQTATTNIFNINNSVNVSTEHTKETSMTDERNLLPMRWTIRNNSVLHVQIESVARVESHGEDDDNSRRYGHGGCRYYGTALDVDFKDMHLVANGALTVAEFLAIMQLNASQDVKSLARTGKTYNSGWVECNSILGGFLGFFTDPNVDNHAQGWWTTNETDTRLVLDIRYCEAELARRAAVAAAEAAKAALLEKLNQARLDVLACETALATAKANLAAIEFGASIATATQQVMDLGTASAQAQCDDNACCDDDDTEDDPNDESESKDLFTEVQPDPEIADPDSDN